MKAISFAGMRKPVLVRLDSRQRITGRLRTIKWKELARLCLNAIYCNLTLFRNTIEGTTTVLQTFPEKRQATQKALVVNAGDLNPAQELATLKNCTQLLFLIKNKISDKEILYVERCLSDSTTHHSQPDILKVI